MPETWAAVIHGDCQNLTESSTNAARCCVTSPPYWNQRNYGTDGELGADQTRNEYVYQLANRLDIVGNILTDDGTLWLNIGDGYHNKELVGMPWRVALELKRRGWILRSDIIWHKTNPIPAGGGVTNRFTPSHEYIFLFAKQHDYYFDMQAVLEPLKHPNATITAGFGGHKQSGNDTYSGRVYNADELDGRRPRDVWSMPVARYAGSHQAVMPELLAERCIKAGSAVGDLVLDPFAGAGTTGLVANRLGRNFLGYELNEEYAEEARRRIRGDAPLFRQVREGR